MINGYGLLSTMKQGSYISQHIGLFMLDATDKMIKFCSIFYYCWKYWHSPMWHYLAICDGGLDPGWGVPQKDQLGFQDFWMKLSEQIP